VALSNSTQAWWRLFQLLLRTKRQCRKIALKLKKVQNGHGQQLEKLHEVGEKKSTVQFAFNPATLQTDKVIGWNCYRVRTSFIAAALCLSSPSMSLRYICAQFAARLTTDVPGIMRHKQNHLDLSLTKIFHTDSEVFPNLVHGLQG